jgi:diacylglycerol kinase
LKKEIGSKEVNFDQLFKMKKLRRSFSFAFQGIKFLLLNERNFKIQFGVFVLVLFLSILFQISKEEWIVLLLCSMIVLSLEGVNTAIEQLCNEKDVNYNHTIKIIKDVAAGAVLISSIISSIIGLIVFIPHFYRLVESL